MIPSLVPFVVLGLIFLGYIGFVVYGLVAAGMCLGGRDFKYALLGRRVESYLGKS